VVGGLLNKAKTNIFLIAGNSLELQVPKCKNLEDWTISSEILDYTGSV